MKHKTRVVVGLVLAIALAAGCRGDRQTPDAAGLQIDFQVEPDPPAPGDATVTVIITDSGGSPVDDASVEVRGDMTHAGMLPVIATSDRGDNGHYVMVFQWTMVGDWIVTVTVTLDDGDPVEKIFEITVTGDGGMEMGEATAMPEMTGESDG